MKTNKKSSKKPKDWKIVLLGDQFEPILEKYFYSEKEALKSGDKCFEEDETDQFSAYDLYYKNKHYASRIKGKKFSYVVKQPVKKRKYVKKEVFNRFKLLDI